MQQYHKEYITVGPQTVFESMPTVAEIQISSADIEHDLLQSPISIRLPTTATRQFDLHLP